MAKFVIYGPFEVPVAKPAGAIVKSGEPADSGKTIVSRPDLEQFWNAMPAGIPDSPGCYVFGMKAGKGMTPLYAGKTSKSLRVECFTPHKVSIYNKALRTYGKGSPILFLLARSKQKGKLDLREIGGIEHFLIDIASTKNPKLLNTQGKKKPKWKIPGVVRSGPGKPTQAAKKFKTMMGLA